MLPTYVVYRLFKRTGISKIYEQVIDKVLILKLLLILSIKIFKILLCLKTLGSWITWNYIYILQSMFLCLMAEYNSSRQTPKKT